MRFLLVVAVALLLSRGIGSAADSPVATHSPAAQSGGIAPKDPRLVFVFESKVKLGELKMTGTYNGYQRGTMQLLGGTFSGPGIQGSILPTPRDWPVYYNNGVRLTDVSYVYVTNDGAQLFVTVDGYRYDPSAMKGVLGEAEHITPAPNLLRTIIRIQAPDNSPYAWMNYNLFVGVAGTAAVAGEEHTATLRVFRIL